MALTGISLCLAMNSNTQAQELFLDGGTAGIGATTPVGNTGVGIFTANPIPNYFDVNGDVRLNGGGGQDDGVKFASPNGEKGLSIFKLNTGNRADLRYDGTTLKLVAGTGTGVPSPNNGISITNDGNTGIGTSPLGVSKLWVNSIGPTVSTGIFSTLFCTAPNLTAVGVSAQANGGFETRGGSFSADGSSDVFGVHAEAQGNSAGGSNATGGYFKALSAENAIGGKFEVEQSDIAYGIEASASANGNAGNIAYGGFFGAVGGEEIYGIKARTFSTPGNKKSYAVYADAYGINAQPQENYGLYAIAELTDGMKNYGVYAKAFNQYANGPQENYGVYAFAESNSNNTINVGVYAKVKGGKYAAAGPNQSYAGVFEGDVVGGNVHANAALFNGGVVATAPGYYQLSDQKFKKNVENVENAIDKVMGISSKTYEFKGKDEFPTFNFSSGRHYGFIAQELETVVPEAIEEFTNPAQYDDNGNKTHDAVTFKSVNYTALIPILTAGIQEQQAIIETQNAKIAELEERLEKLEKGGTTGIGSTGTPTVNGAALYQNTPNPFNSHTEIGYKLPQQYTEAKIMVFDMNGRQVRTVALTGEAEGKVSFYPNELAAGMYMYSLVIDGREIDTKRMILSGR